jgi:hypothetical protein
VLAADKLSVPVGGRLGIRHIQVNVVVRKRLGRQGTGERRKCETTEYGREQNSSHQDSFLRNGLRRRAIVSNFVILCEARNLSFLPFAWTEIEQRFLAPLRMTTFWIFP